MVEAILPSCLTYLWSARGGSQIADHEALATFSGFCKRLSLESIGYGPTPLGCCATRCAVTDEASFTTCDLWTAKGTVHGDVTTTSAPCEKNKYLIDLESRRPSVRFLVQGKLEAVRIAFC